MRGGRASRQKGNRAERVLGLDHVVEVKVRGSGFSQLYSWLDGRDMLVVRADRKKPLVVVPLPLAIEIATAAERNKGGNS